MGLVGGRGVAAWPGPSEHSTLGPMAPLHWDRVHFFYFAFDIATEVDFGQFVKKLKS